MQPNEPQQPQPTVPQTPSAPADALPIQPVAPAPQPIEPLPDVNIGSPPVAVESQPIPTQPEPYTVVSSEAESVSSGAPADQLAEPNLSEPIVWQSNEYAQHDKPPLWYIGLAVVVLVLMGVAIWLGAWTFAALIPVMVVALMVYTHRPPQVINYAVSEQGLFINDTLHPMGEFRAFAVGQEMEHNSLMLVPVKRFRPAIKVFFPQEVGEQLVDLIGAYVPSQDYHVDAFDKIIQKLHI